MSKNPFSIYDFMGYLFPGLFLLIILVYVRNENFDISNIFRFKTLMGIVGDDKSTFDLDKSILIIILGYITGHFVSYSSSLTIETFANNIFGYPSDYLLHGNKLSWWDMLKRYFSCQVKTSCKMLRWIKLFCKFVLKLFVFTFLLPISLMVFLLGWLVDVNSYITRPIDDYLKTSILKKQYELANLLNIKKADVNERCDYHRLDMHYVYIHVTECQKKVDNYISLYGFLRSITFVFCICFDCCLFYSLQSVNFDLEINWSIIFELIVLYAMCILSFLGFMKFYRRNTLENFMTLLVGLESTKSK